MPVVDRMRFVWRGLLLLSLLLPQISAAQSGTTAAPAEKRIALVIGNGGYPSAALRNPVNDATAVAQKLREMGFDVVLRNDVNLRQMTRAISEFGTRITSDSVALFYYAGHGLQARGRNFLVPVDADIVSEGSISSESVDVERVLDQLSASRLSMVVLDACRNNPFERRFRSGAGRGLAQIDAPAGTLIAYATAPGKVASDGEGAHGTYTEALLGAIGIAGLKVEDVFKQVRIQVLKATANQQIPWESSSLTGEFLFRPAKLVIPDQGQQQKAEQDAAAVRAQLALLSAEMAKLREIRTAPDPNLAKQEQERKKADQEAAALRDQMALLRAEITKVRESRPPPSPVTAANEQEQKKAEQEAAALRDQMALMSAEISKLRENRPAPSSNPFRNAQEQKKADQETAAAREQLALLNAEISSLRAGVPAPTVATPEQKAAWKKQFAKLEAARGKLTLATAMATLLETQADISSLRAFESDVRSRAYSAGLAMGVDASGLLVWGGSYGQLSQLHATEIALDFCAGAGGSRCRAVILNGSFAEDAWFEVVKQLGTQPVEAVRAGFVSSLRQPVLESNAGVGGGSTSAARGRAFGYTFARSSAK